MASPNARNFVKPNLNEPLKEYFIYDVLGRLTDHYETSADARDGDPCLHTRYAFQTPTSPLVTYRVETMATWDVTWEQ